MAASIYAMNVHEKRAFVLESVKLSNRGDYAETELGMSLGDIRTKSRMDDLDRHLSKLVEDGLVESIPDGWQAAAAKGLEEILVAGEVAMRNKEPESCVEIWENDLIEVRAELKALRARQATLEKCIGDYKKMEARRKVLGNGQRAE